MSHDGVVRRSSKTFRAGSALTLLGVLCLLSGHAGAATLTVDTLAQGSVAGCSLAEAIASINAGADTGGCVATGPAYGTADTINLPPGTFNLAVIDNGANGLPVITKTLTINGNGATIARTGAPLFRFFEVTAGSLTLNDLTLTGGDVGPGGAGGAINAPTGGTLTLTNVRLSSNTAKFGGAVDTGFTGDLIITGSTFTNNTATSAGSAFGGAIDTNHTGNLTITSSTFTNNRATAGGGNNSAFGGAIDAANIGTLTIIDSTFTNNTATGSGTGSAFGGAVDAVNTLDVTVTGSTFLNNTAASSDSAFGGALDADNGGNLTVSGSTFRGNAATSGGDTAFGGAIDVSSNGNLSVTTSTFANNRATGVTSFGGAIDADYTGATGLINNNCFVADTAQTGGGVARGLTPKVDATNNWWGDASGPSGFGPGTGDSVDANSIFSPFLTAVPATCNFALGVPTLSQWAQFAMVALMVLGGLLALRRRQRPARPASA